MNWNTAARRLTTWLRPSDESQSPDEVARNEVGRSGLTADDPVDMNHAAGPKIRKLRRRLLSRKGARLQVSMADRQDKGMLSILDVYGVVVYWHDGSQASAIGVKDVLDRHVAQFYAPKRQSLSLANDHLSKAFARGASSEFGWRRRADGTVFWGVTVVEPLVLADGRLQGFTHVTRAVIEPRESVARVQHQSTGVWSDAPSLRCVSADMRPRSAPLTAFRQPLHARRTAPRAAFA